LLKLEGYRPGCARACVYVCVWAGAASGWTGSGKVVEGGNGNKWDPVYKIHDA